MITFYTIHCAKCSVLERKLIQKGIKFETVSDEATVVEKGLANGIKSAPLLEVDGKIMDYMEAIKFVNAYEEDTPCDVCNF